MISEIQSALRRGPALPAGVFSDNPDRQEVRAWSAPASFGWAVLVYLGTTILMGLPLGLMIYATRWAARSGDLQALRLNMEVGSTSLVTAFALIAPLQMGFLWLLTRKRESVAGAYLGWRGFSAREFGYWLAWTTIHYLVFDALSYAFPSEQNSVFMYVLYEFGGGPVLLTIGIVLAAPWFEELLFRGFLYQGFRQEARSPIAAITITAILWAATHGQYDLQGVIGIFTLGIVLGIVRERTGSTRLTFVLHAIFNAVALAECWLLWDVLEAPAPVDLSGLSGGGPFGP